MKSLLTLLIYAITVWGATLIFTRMGKNITEFMVADREVHWWPMSLSIAATWCGAPAIFVSVTLAFTAGLTGYLWFFIPNVAALMIFGWLGHKLRAMYPNGFTYVGLVNKVYGTGVKKVYLLNFLLVTTLNSGLMLAAGTAVLKALSPEISVLSYDLIIMGVTLAYCLWSGIKGDIVTDNLQMYGILIPLFLFFAIVLFKVPNVGLAFLKGLGGLKGNMANPFNKVGLSIFLASGLFTLISQTAGPAGDEAYWQRIFVSKKETLHRAFIVGALLFGLVPFLMGIIGFIAVGSGFVPVSMNVGSFEFIVHAVGTWWAAPLFIYMAMSVLISTVDSNLVGGASLMADIDPRHFTVKSSRWMMLAIAIGGILIVLLPGSTILFLTYLQGTVRAPSFIISICTMMHIKFNAQGVKWGILIPLIVGPSLFIWGSYAKVNNLRVAGALICTLAPPLIAWVTTMITDHRSHFTIPADKVYIETAYEN